MDNKIRITVEELADELADLLVSKMLRLRPGVDVVTVEEYQARNKERKEEALRIACRLAEMALAPQGTEEDVLAPGSMARLIEAARAMVAYHCDRPNIPTVASLRAALAPFAGKGE